jgi:hypothetical protein
MRVRAKSKGSAGCIQLYTIHRRLWVPPDIACLQLVKLGQAAGDACMY